MLGLGKVSKLFFEHHRCKELVIKARQEKLRYNNLLLDIVFSYYQSVDSGPKIKEERRKKIGAATLASIW